MIEVGWEGKGKEDACTGRLWGLWIDPSTLDE